MDDIRVITEPSVYLLSRPRLDGGDLCRMLSESGADTWHSTAGTDAEALVEVAGRTCYQSWHGGRGSEDHLRHLLEVGHGSVIEHANWTLALAGISRSLGHEFIRSRAGFAYSELSQRFVDCENVAFVVPPALLPGMEPEGAPLASAYGVWLTGCDRASADYSLLAAILTAEAPRGLLATDRRKWARQAARSVLPECAETKLVVTANARAWRWWLEQRGSAGADAEIRRLAVAILAKLRPEAPVLFGDLEVTAAGCIEARYRKV